MKRFTEKMVFVGFVTDCLFAASPITHSPLWVKATILGVVRAPSEFSRTTALPPFMTDMQEFVVPRSMPRINRCVELAVGSDAGTFNEVGGAEVATGEGTFGKRPANARLRAVNRASSSALNSALSRPSFTAFLRSNVRSCSVSTPSTSVCSMSCSSISSAI